MKDNLAPLREPAFRRLLVSYTVNELGDSVGVVALAILVYDRTGDPLATTLLFLFARFLPAFVSPALTAHLDRRSLRWVLGGLYTAEGAVFAALALVADAFWLPAVLALALLDGTLALSGRGLTRGAVAAVLEPKSLLREGNALVNIGFAAASVLGAALGGVLVAAAGVATALLVDAASFLLIAVLLATSRRLPAGAQGEAPAFLARLREGLTHAWRHRPARVLLGGQAIALILFTLIVPIEVVYAKETLAAGDAGYGWLLAAWGAGIMIGSLVYVRVEHARASRLILVSTAAIGLAYCGMALAPTILVACAWSVLGGAGNGVQYVSVVTAVQERTPAVLQARVSGLFESIGAAMPGIGFVLGGALTELGSPRLAFAVAGGGLLLLLTVGWIPARRVARAGGPTAEVS
jgi:MFS family permease